MKFKRARLFEIRTALKISRANLALSAGVNNATIRRMETDPEYDPCLSTVSAIAMALKTAGAKITVRDMIEEIPDLIASGDERTA